MKLVFCGTPEFAVGTLEAVITAGHEVALAVSQPDRAAGRGMEMQAPPVKRTAVAHGITLVQPEKIRNNAEFRERLEQVQPDAIVVVAYGRIIPSWMLELPPLGCINLHGSLLPKYRGAAPVQWAVANGDAVTGVTTMRLDEGLDTGEMLLARELAIGADETAVDVFRTLAAVGAELMVETLAGLAAGTLKGRKQDEAQATLAPILTREDGAIDFARTARQIYDRWRGFQPWPGAHTILRGKKLIVHRMHVVSESGIEAGVLRVAGDAMAAGCGGRGSVVLDEVQMEGKRRMSAAEFMRGYQIRSGERLGL
ncbi:MAG TPA: methionyl-tRNA formyltransferase [Acidobacteriaceae bacterium]|jgi:methionyl-tRNA formyltransferase|nr:methionyl-tRNA formyltransferase [Acidobacteriaceae bacterium]